MTSGSIFDESVTSKIKKVSEYIDTAYITKIINKLTDYAEIITAGKLSGIINYNYRLDSTQSRLITDLLIDIGALSRIHNIASKGSQDLEEEYVSNIFSDAVTPANISSYISLRTIIENRLSHQVQQYNMNMGKTNTSNAMPLNELRGHVKTYIDLSVNELSVSTKAYHGYIAASLHDAYVILLNRADWWNDRTYMKFFLNEDDPSKRSRLLISKDIRPSLNQINENIKELLKDFEDIRAARVAKATAASEEAALNESSALQSSLGGRTSMEYTDKLLQTPFGKQYGRKIDSIIQEIFPIEVNEKELEAAENELKVSLPILFSTFQELPTELSYPENINTVVQMVNYLIPQHYGIKTFTEQFLHTDKKMPFSRFYSGENKEMIELFLTQAFTIYIEKKFDPLFRLIKSLDMKKYACAFAIKRIYILLGENLTSFGYFLIKTVARIGKIKA